MFVAHIAISHDIECRYLCSSYNLRVRETIERDCSRYTDPLNRVQSVVDSHLYAISELLRAGTYLRQKCNARERNAQKNPRFIFELSSTCCC